MRSSRNTLSADDGEWEQIVSWLVANPERSSGDIFWELQRRSPGRYQPLQIRTLQRGWQDEVIYGPAPEPLSSAARPTRSPCPPVEHTAWYDFGGATQV